MSDESEIARVVTTRAEAQATYDRIARYYELVEGSWERRARSAGLAALPAKPGESLLGIGCGQGTRWSSWPGWSGHRAGS